MSKFMISNGHPPAPIKYSISIKFFCKSSMLFLKGNCMAIFTNVQKSDTPLHPLMFFLMVLPLKNILRNNIPGLCALFTICKNWFRYDKNPIIQPDIHSVLFQHKSKSFYERIRQDKWRNRTNFLADVSFFLHFSKNILVKTSCFG